MNLIEKYPYSMDEKLNNFEKYVRRQDLARFLARYEIFKMAKNTKGSIIECGVHMGGGLMAWAKMCATLDVFDIYRKVIGFDTFDGFTSLSEQDLSSQRFSDTDQMQEKFFAPPVDMYAELQESIAQFDENRFINHFPKVELIKGDANETIPQYIKDNKHLSVSILFLDFDLYEPTLTALKHFAPRMVKGALLCFDELNNYHYKGETIAALEHFGSFNHLEFKKFDFDTTIAYAVI